MPIYQRLGGTCLALTLLAGCLNEEEEPDLVAAESREEDETSLDDRLPGASLERPCAEKTVAQIQVRNGNRMSFCVVDRGKGIYVEVGPEGSESYLDELGIRDPLERCAVDLYMEVTDESRPLPVELLEACPSEQRQRDDYDRREPVRGGYFEEIVEPQALSYCGANGKANFKAEMCPVCDPYDDCVSFCTGDAMGWHQRTLSISLGEEGNVAMESNASCNGKTLVRGWDRDDVGDSWGYPDIDFWLGSGKSSWKGFMYGGGLEDYDFKLRGDSESGAFHRYGSYFSDW